MAYPGWKVGEDEEVQLLRQNVGKGGVTSPQTPAFIDVFKFQVMSEGGPQPQSIIHFSISVASRDLSCFLLTVYNPHI